MPTLLVIRLHPSEAIAAEDFSDYLDGLSISAHELSHADPEGSGPAFGTADFVAPNLPPSPSADPTPVADANTEISQHFTIIPVPPAGNFARTMFSVATAVIEIPDPGANGEYQTADVRLVITRNGSDIVHKQRYYNVPVAAAPAPADANDYQNLDEVSLHLALPAPGQQYDPTVTVPEDGTAPNFDNLRAAVEAVLNAEPGNLNDIADLTVDEARHIAYQIVWDREAFPLPEPTMPMEEMYTGPNAANSDEERERQIFEGALLTYYVKHNSQADQLTNFVFSLSAAIWCEQQSDLATIAGFTFPVFADAPARYAKANLTGPGNAALNPAFLVPAVYFYALSGVLPVQVKRQLRFNMAVLESEQQSRAVIEQAIDDHIIDEDAAVNAFQAARRLPTLGSTNDVGTPRCDLIPGTDLQTLITGWLGFAGADIEDFWTALNAAETSGHLELVLCAVTHAHAPLMNAIMQPAFGVNNVSDLANKTNQDWENLLHPDANLLPPFTAPGTTQERTQAFIRNLRHFFDVANVVDPPPPPEAQEFPQLPRSPGNPVDELLAQYPGGFTFANWDNNVLSNTLDNIFPGDPDAKAEFKEWLACIQGVIQLTEGITPESLRFSVMEGLWARGIPNAQTLEHLSFNALKDALVGSVAYDFAQTIWDNAQAQGIPTAEPGGVFVPINPDGSLVNCIPPKHVSPLGPIAYLKDLLEVSEASTCDDPLPDDQTTLSQLLQNRRGPLGDLLASHSNLCIPLPLIDIVNESLEHMVANDVDAGTVYNTAADQVVGHFLDTNHSQSDEFKHDAETLFEALPEHSTSATPTAQQSAWDLIMQDFSACNLPYHQPLDVTRSYLEQLGTSRYATMRSFRRHITEFVLDPSQQTAEFQSHLWRYPVAHELALEYLCITAEEYNLLYSPGSLGPAKLPSLFGLLSNNNQPNQWIQIVIKLPEFLKRTCLSYCEFIELWQSEFVEFRAADTEDGEFPICEPCCIEEFVIEFENPADPASALKLLAVFIRLWRTLNNMPNTAYSFSELADLANAFELFHGTTANEDFVRQLAAFQLLRDEFELTLTDGSPLATNATGHERMHLLALWEPSASKRNWAIQHLLDQIQQYALCHYHCACRPPEFLKLLKQNLDPLSALVGFDPDNASDTWHAEPTHTLRFVEILAKIYASDFQLGELFFLFTTDPQLQGDDPYPLQTDNEALDLPFGLPDDEDEQSLFALRSRLLAIEVDEDAAEQWTWARMGYTLHSDFGLDMPPASDRWLEFGKHFFPETLAAQGHAVAPQESMYRTPLAGTSTAMWNTPFDGPFQYDAGASELWSKIALTDEAVIAKLSRIRQLTAAERNAVSELYFQPRTELVFFSFLFDNQLEAERYLIEQEDENKRWQWFRWIFQRFVQRCHAIAEHLAEHVQTATAEHTPKPGSGKGCDSNKNNDDDSDNQARAAMLLLKHLWADENEALSPWENDNGQVPNVTWPDSPNGGAFAALLGVTGTGLLAEYFDSDKLLRWREVRGGIDAFGEIENKNNSPIPTVIPSMNFSFDAEQLQYAAVRNGFAMANTDGDPLGGGEPFLMRWTGLLLIEQTGKYGFSAGAPTEGEEKPDFEAVRRFHRWCVRLQQGQKRWVLLSHNWPKEEAPADCASAIKLERGFYEISIEFERLPVVLDGPEDVCPQTTGFQLKYDGPDAGDKWLAIPNDKLFIKCKDSPMNHGFDTGVTISGGLPYLATHYVSTVRDMRRTYQRAFKAMLFVSRHQLSADPVADDGQSEIEYLLSQPEAFAGYAYYRDGGGFTTHLAFFNFNFLPLLDRYCAPDPTDDERADPSNPRMQAMFDWWERLFDYTVMRAATQRSPEIPVWLLFHEAVETHEDNPAHLLRQVGVNLRHIELVLQHFDPAEGDLSYDVTSDDLEDERWAIRVWRADLWVRQLNHHFLAKDITEADVFLWASDGPDPDGIANLTQFYRDGCIENDQPRRYKEIKRLNDGLRLRGRAALIAYLTHMNRVSLPWGGFATHAKELGELLLLDVDVGLCQKASRIEEAITAVQLFINRARLGLESSFVVSADFLFAWQRHFATFHTWQTCRRRTIYRENWIEWDEMAKAEKSEAFQFLQSELRRSDLTLPQPGGLVYWNAEKLPPHSHLTLLQAREPATMTMIEPPPEGLGLLGTPDRHARLSWLSPVRGRGVTPPPDPDRPDPDRPNDDQPDPDRPNDDPPPVPILRGRTDRGAESGRTVVGGPDRPREFEHNNTEFPMWFQAAVRLGTRFLRVAAAGIPLASTEFKAQCRDETPTGCCHPCCEPDPVLIDEYYFWLESSETYEPQEQVAQWGATPDDPQNGIIGDPKSDWHRDDQLPSLLHWKGRPIVHLKWCRVHQGQFQVPRQSSEGVLLAPGADPQLLITGRTADSLVFEVQGGDIPVGYPPAPPAGFRYDIKDDHAITLPEVVASPLPGLVGGLAAFPYFALHTPGAPLLPQEPFNSALAVSQSLATHCRYEEALKWLELLYNPLVNDNEWADCEDDDGRGDGDDIPTPNIPGVPDSDIPTSDIPTTDADGDGRGEVEPGVCCCPSDPVSGQQAKQRLIVMLYLDVLLNWVDALQRVNTPEAFHQARLLADTAARIMGERPITVLATAAVDSATDDQGRERPVRRAEFACPPLNPRLMCLYNRLADRLELIHTCLNAYRLQHGRPNLDMPYFGNDPTRECWKLGKDACMEAMYWCKPQSPYRFLILIQKAIELANETRSLGNQLLSAYEKGDADYLSQLRVQHERQINELTLQIKQNQWRDADWQVQVLRKAKEIALTKLQYYKNLIATGLISGEAQYEPLVITSTSLRAAGNVVAAIGQAMNLIPDPNVGFPTNFLTLPPGKKLAMIFAASGTISNTAADIIKSSADLGLTKTGWERREDEWQHQVDVLTIEVDQIERQILGAERRRDAALRELNNHQQVTENSAEVHDFLRDKFTNHAFYLWLQQNSAALHQQMFELALHCAHQAQCAFNYERGHLAIDFIQDQCWDDLHEGLLAGEQLMLSLKRMEKAYYDENVREYELTKHISLRQHFPEAFLQLQTTGYCEIGLPEWLFDLDYPGHYMRRIKNVTVTIPCVVGPYIGVHCRLTLLNCRTRVSPELLDPAHVCCDEQPIKNGYLPLKEDSRFIKTYGATEAIATSAGQNDSGMFELNFRDERYLPFEFDGAVSRWRIELPLENNHFNMESLSDFVLNLRFTAREGGNNLRAAANECAQKRLPDNGTRFIDAKRELGGQWRELMDDDGCHSHHKEQARVQRLGLYIANAMFPYLTGNLEVAVNRLEILFEAPDAKPSTHHNVTLFAHQPLDKLDPATCKEDVYTIGCVGDAAWPGFYHGVIELDFGTISRNGYLDLGVLQFDESVGKICSTFLLIGYSAVKGFNPCREMKSTICDYDKL